MNAQPAQASCFVCGKKIENNAFARLISGNASIFLCSPNCALAHYARVDKNSSQLDRTFQADSVQSSHDWYDLDASLAGQNGKY